MRRTVQTSTSGFGLGLGLLLLPALLVVAGQGCTTEDPLYCERDEDCAADHVCDVPVHTCRPGATDGGGEAAPPDGLVPDAKADTGGGPETGTPDAGPDAADDAAVDAADAGPDLLWPDTVSPDTVPPDSMPPDTKFWNGTACTSPAQCASGSCSDKVCCDKACAGACDSCNQTGKKGTCTFLPAKTTCGATTCTGSTLAIKQCSGTSAACPTVSSSCAPYTCAAAGAQCATSCTAHTGCTTGLCDLFDIFATKNKCAASSKLCYADVAKACPGSGTQAAPHCTIQACLDQAVGYVAVANGTYAENLTTKASTAIIATGTVGKLLVNGLPQAGVAKVVLTPTKAATPGVLIGGAFNAVLHGFEVKAGGGGSGALVQVSTRSGKVWLRSCYLHNASSGSALLLDKPVSGVPNQSVTVEDTSATVSAHGVHATSSDLTLNDVGLRSNTVNGLYLDKCAAQVRDAVIQLNSNIGVYSLGSALDLDRVKVSFNFGEGMLLEGGSTGTAFNVLVADNGKVGIELYGYPTPKFVNVTLANNVGYEVSCGGNTSFYNSVVWDKNNSNSITGTASCYFIYSNVRGGATGTGNINLDPKFVGSGTHPYALLDATSPCVDTGQDTVSGVTLPALDLAGKLRKVDKITTNSTVIDMGAYEVQ